MRVTIYDCTNPAWGDQAKRAKASGVAFANTVAPYAPPGVWIDRDAELCRTQRAQAAAGYVSAELSSNIYGYCIRDTMNDGQGRMSPNFKTPVEALLWAKEWHAKAPESRRISAIMPEIKPYYTEKMRAEAEAEAEAISFILAVEAGGSPLSCLKCRRGYTFPTFLAGVPLCYACGDRVEGGRS
jgi:hypothetical protein